MPGTGSSTSSDQNRSYVTNDGRAATFGRSLIQYIQNRLPYATDGRAENDALNPKYKFFQITIFLLVTLLKTLPLVTSCMQIYKTISKVG